MDIFITWSGPRSFAVAEALKEYLPMVVNDFSPWLSTADIDKGANWRGELTTALNNARAGIICLTPSNLTAPWLLFEAGAIAKRVEEKPLACTLLIGVESSDLSGPLTLFQDTKPTRDDLLRLIKTLNKALGDEARTETQIEGIFGIVWPKLEERLSNLPSDGPAERPRRSEREMLEELVDLQRSKSASDAMLLGQLGQAEGKISELTVRLASAETSLSLERERARLAGGAWSEGLKGVLSRERAAEALKDVLKGGAVASSGELADPNAAAAQRVAVVTKAARTAKMSPFRNEARNVDPKDEP
jgi:hypothetical protein